MSKKMKLILFTCLIVVLIIALQNPAPSSPPTTGKADIGGAFTLTDQHGRPFSSDALKGRHSLIFLGYSNCPDICPATLLLLGDTLKKLGPDADKVNTVFISVDSQNDSPEKLAEYLKNFDPRIVALTGDEAQIESIIKAYKGYAKRPDDAAPGNTLISHSGWIYLMDKDGNYISHFDSNVHSDTLVQAVKAAL